MINTQINIRGNPRVFSLNSKIYDGPLVTVRMGRERKRCAVVGVVCNGNAKNCVLSVRCQLCA